MERNKSVILYGAGCQYTLAARYIPQRKQFRNIQRTLLLCVDNVQARKSITAKLNESGLAGYSIIQSEIRSTMYRNSHKDISRSCEKNAGNEENVKRARILTSEQWKAGTDIHKEKFGISVKKEKNMHKSTILRMQWFAENYIGEGRVLDVGSYDNTYSYRNLFKNKNVEYVGLDICKGPNVDVIMDQPYRWNILEDESFDYVISGQAFEHIEYPWLTIKEIYRKIKPGGICCLIAPNSAGEHKAPKDCYRFFSDGFAALAKWAGFEVINCTVSGIPNVDVSPDWDCFDNDVCLICRKPLQKKCEEKTTKEYPRFQFERRISGMLDQKLRYKFMLKWLELKETGSRFWLNFVNDSHSSDVYIYGYGSIGKLLYEELVQDRQVKVHVVDQHVKRTTEGEAIKREIEISGDSGGVMLITVLDSNRDLKAYLDKLYPQMQKYYVDELIESEVVKKYFSKHGKVYLYGAGDYGERVLKFLERNGLSPAGFIVSDGKKRQDIFLQKPVYELKEVMTEQDIGIILSVSFAFEKEIENILMDREMDFITCDTVGVYSAPYGCMYSSRG